MVECLGSSIIWLVIGFVLALLIMHGMRRMKKEESENTAEKIMEEIKSQSQN